MKKNHTKLVIMISILFLLTSILITPINATSLQSNVEQKDEKLSVNNANPPLGYEYMAYPDDEIAVLGYLEPAGYINAVRIYENQGTANNNWESYSDCNYAAIELCDFNHDDKEEVVLLKKETKGINIKILYSDGTDISISQSGEYWPRDIACGDFNGDLENEIAVLVGDWDDARRVTILDCYGSVLADRVKLSGNLDYLDWKTITAGDVDGDFIDEIVALSKNTDQGKSTICVRHETLIEEDDDPIADSYCTFKPGGEVVSIACGDLNGDSLLKEEIILLGHIGQYMDDYKVVSETGETLIDWDNIPDGYGEYIGAGDFDKDGDKEIVVATSFGRIQIFDPSGLDGTPFPGKDFEITSKYGIAGISCGDVDGDGIKIKYVQGSKITFNDDEYYPIALLYHPPCLDGFNSGEYIQTYSAYGHKYTTVNSESNTVGVKAETLISFAPKLAGLLKVTLKGRFRNYIDEKTGYGSAISYSTTYKTGTKKQPWVILEKTIYDIYTYEFINGPSAGETFTINLPTEIITTSRSLSSYNNQRVNAPEIISDHKTGDPTSYTIKNNDGCYNQLKTDWYLTAEGPQGGDITIGQFESKEFSRHEEVSYTMGLTVLLGFECTSSLVSSDSHKITVADMSTFGFQLDGLPSQHQSKWKYRYYMYLRRNPTYNYIVVDFYVDPASLGSGYVDNDDPTININEPKKGYIYFSGRELMPLHSVNNFDCITIQPMSLRIYAIDSHSGVDKVEVFFDGNNFLAMASDSEENIWHYPIINNNYYMPEIHTYKAKAFDGVGRTAVTEERKICSVMGNSPPYLNLEILGPNTGKAGNSYSFSAKALEIEGEDLFYYIDWGDNTNTEWIGPIKTNMFQIDDESIEDLLVNIEGEHTWKRPGTYTITIQVKDSNENIGLYELTKDVTIGRKSINRSFSNLFKLFDGSFFLKILQKLLQNSNL